MKRRILKTITVLLLMIVAIAGFMPYTSKEVQAETKRILNAAGRKGIILGADCTVPKDISFDRFEWVREAAK